MNESQSTSSLGTIQADDVWFPFAGKTNSGGTFEGGSQYGEIFSVTPNEGGYYARSFKINSSFNANQEINSFMKESKPVRCIME